MASSKFTEFGIAVKKALLDKGMSQKELEALVAEHTSLFVDAGYMYKILTGRRDAPKIVAAISKILDIDAE